MLPNALQRRMDRTSIDLLLDHTRRLPPLVCESTIRIAVAGTDESGMYGHTMTWASGILTEWTTVAEPEADVTITETGFVQVDGWNGIPLGCDAATRKEMEGWTVDQVPDAQLTVVFGQEATQSYLLRWASPCLEVHNAAPEQPSELCLSMSYQHALEWLWGPLLLGHLLWENQLPLKGNFFVLSAIEGVVSAPTIDGPRQERLDVLRSLSRLFKSGTFDDIAARLAPSERISAKDSVRAISL